MMSKMNRDDLLELIPAYVLGALDPDEQAQVEALLVDDVEAQTIADEYRQMTGEVLPLMAELREPAPDLKGRLMERIHEDAPSSPDTIDAPSTSGSSDAPAPTPQTSSTRKILRLSLFVPVAAALVLAIIGLGVVLQDFITSQTPQGVFQSLSSEMGSTRVTVGGDSENPVRGELVVASNQERAALRLSQLPSLQTDQTFQLWLVDADGAQSGGLFQTDNGQEAYLVIPNEKPISQYAGFGVSVEPEGGSPLGNAPSGDPIIRIAPPSQTDQEQ